MARTIADVMTASPRTVDPGTPLIEAARAMRDADVGALIVVEGEQVGGVVTDRDIVVRAIAEGSDPSSAQVSDVCSRDLTTVESSEPVEQAVKLMRDRDIRRLPVVEGGRPVGIVSLGDLAVERDPDSALADISAADPNR